jgi:hypothetical protein
VHTIQFLFQFCRKGKEDKRLSLKLVSSILFIFIDIKLIH